MLSQTIFNCMPPILKAAIYDKIAEVMTMRELMEICIDWSYNYALDGFKYKEIPRPDFVKTYQVMNREVQKRQQDNIEFKDKYMTWLEEDLKNKHHNQSNKEWLQRMLVYYEYKQDQEKVDNIQEMLNGY